MDTLFGHNDNLQIDNNLLKRFEEIHDFIYANDGLSPQQTLNELIKILFVKMFDENNKLRTFSITPSEFAKAKSNNPLIHQKIQNLFEKTKKDYKDIFDSDDKIKLSDVSLGYVVNKLQNISITQSSDDAKGLAFQKFISHKMKDDKGQFFTPDPVIKFCVNIINPKKDEIIIDPCCGSGGFLYCSLQHIIKNNRTTDIAKIIKNNIYGIDINKDIVKIARMKFLLEANVKNNIFCYNSLGDIDTVKLQLAENMPFKNEGFDILLTNPPFGSSGKILDTHILSSFNLGYKWEKTGNGFARTNSLSNGQPAEILFIERCLQLLKEGGRMAIVLPNGHFENPSLEYLRYFIKQHAKILGVVNLPQETFIPYGTGVKTSLLFLKKESLNIEKKYHLFFGKITKLGYQGNKNGTPVYKKDSLGNNILENGSPIVDEDFSSVINDYKSFINNNDIKSKNSFTINFNELNGRLDYNFYSPENQNVINKLTEKSVRLADIVSIVKSKSKKLQYKNNTVEYVELSDINTHSFEIINSTTYQVHELPSRASYEIKKGDIITAIAGNSVGTTKHATAIVSSQYDGAICTNGFRVLRNPKINPFYLLFFLHSPFFLQQMMMYRTGAAIPNVSDIDLNNILVYIPNSKTLEKIANAVEESLNMKQKSEAIINNISLNI